MRKKLLKPGHSLKSKKIGINRKIKKDLQKISANLFLFSLRKPQRKESGKGIDPCFIGHHSYKGMGYYEKNKAISQKTKKSQKRYCNSH